MAYHNGPAVDTAIFSLHVVGMGSLVGGLNFLVTNKDVPVFHIKGEKAELYLASISVTSFLLVASIPVLAGGITMLLFDRNFNTTFF